MKHNWKNENEIGLPEMKTNRRLRNSNRENGQKQETNHAFVVHMAKNKKRIDSRRYI